MKYLKIENKTEQENFDDGLSFAEGALKRQKCAHYVPSEDFIDRKFLLPTSNICKRLFSRVGYAFSQRGKGLCPANLESQLFLHLNNDFWDNSDVNKLSLT